MPRKSIVVVDVIWEFRMSKQMQISTKAARSNVIPTDVSKRQNRFNKKQMGCFCLNVI